MFSVVANASRFAYGATLHSSIMLRSLAVIGAAILLVGLAYVLYSRFRPRVPLACRSHDLDEFADDLYAAVDRHVQAVERVADRDSRVASLAGRIASLRANRIDAQDWRFFFMFRDYLRGEKGATRDAMWAFTRFDDNVLADMAPDGVRQRLCPNGKDVDQMRLEAYRVGPAAAMNAFRADVALVSSALGALDPTSDAELLAARLAVHELDVALNDYDAAIVRSWNLRRAQGFFKLQLSLLKIYFSELTHYVFVKMIKGKAWGAFKGWIDYLRDRTVRMLRSAKDAVWDLMMAETFEPEPEQEGPVVEHFGALISPLLNIGKVFKLVVTFAKKLADFVTNPASFILWLIRLALFVTLGMALAMLDIVYSAVFSYPVSFLLAFAVCSGITLAWLALYVLGLVALIVATVLDMATKGGISTLLRCENAPDAWAAQPGFKDRNLYARMLGCFAPCAAGFRPSKGGLTCVPLPVGEPAFCPQQFVYTAGARRADAPRAQLHAFRPTAEFWAATDVDKLARLYAYHDELQAYMASCASTYERYDRLPRSMCANLDALLPKDASKDDRETLRRLCTLTYCDFARPGDARPKFCPVAAPPVVPGPPGTEPSPQVRLVSRVLSTVVALAMLLALLLSLYARFGAAAVAVDAE